MRVLLTGASGFIGSHVARALIWRGDEVLAVVRSAARLDRLRDIEDQLKLIRLDLSQEHAGVVLANLTPDVTVHLAWYAEPGSYLHAVEENLRSLRSSIGLLEHLVNVGCPRIVCAGTCVEPLAGKDPARPKPRSVYSATKSALHEVIARLAEVGFGAACAHIYYPYGPFEDQRRFIPTLLRRLAENEIVPVTRGEQLRHYMHVEDVASAIIAIATHEVSGSIDVCAGDPVRLFDVIDVIGRLTGKRDLIGIGEVPYSKTEFMSAIGDPARLEEIGWTPEYELEDGLAATIEWWSSQGVRAASPPVRA